MLTADQWLQLAGLVFTAGCVYSAIRVDLVNLHRDMTEVKASVEKTHARIDEHVQLHLERKI